MHTHTKPPTNPPTNPSQSKKGNERKEERTNKRAMQLVSHCSAMHTSGRGMRNSQICLK